MSELRRTLRKDPRARRAAISVGERMAAAAATAGHLLELPALRRANRVAGYWAVGGELPLHILMNRLPDSAHYHLPVLHTDGTLRFAGWRVGDPVVANRFGIPEPEQTSSLLPPESMDVVLLPLVGFTRRGDRLGTGGGWYDRSFAFRRKTAAPPLLVGVGFACQQVDACDAQEWDVPLDALATERELLVWGRGSE